MRTHAYQHSTIGRILMLSSGTLLFLVVSAENASSDYREPVRARLGEVLESNTQESFLLLQVGTTTITAHYNKQTEFYMGTGEIASQEILQPGLTVYIFGILNEDNTTMMVEKIVLRNKSKLTRKTQNPPRSGFISWLLKNEEASSSMPETRKIETNIFNLPLEELISNRF